MILVWPSLMFSNEIETSDGHVSSTTAGLEVPLGFLDAPGFPLKNTSKLEKCQKSREIAIFFFGQPSYVLSNEN